MKSIYTQLPDYLENEINVSLATVVSTDGSAPQIPGSSAIYCSGVTVHGTIGGGSVEADTGKLSNDPGACSDIYTFNLANRISEKEKPVCGGLISILLDVNPNDSSEVFRKIRDSLKSQSGGVLATLINQKGKKRIKRFWITGAEVEQLPEQIRKAAGGIITGILSGIDVARCHMIELSDTENLFLEPVSPSPMLVIAGAGHIGRSLAHIASYAGFEVTVIDDRPEFANRMNIPDATRILTGNIGTVLRETSLSGDSYIVIVTRGHKDDAEALRECIGKDVQYIGMIGSRSKTSAMKQEFLKNGWANEEQWSGIYTPVGLDINSRTVEEIAISIVAELIMVKNSRKGKRSSCPA
ncbi:MAG TPA: XdhC/CoxI family protein [Bacteroidales bacterium]|nr:XdhC/CoxI family protein [Bacteroidales bacterium]